MNIVRDHEQRHIDIYEKYAEMLNFEVEAFGYSGESLDKACANAIGQLRINWRRQIAHIERLYKDEDSEKRHNDDLLATMDEIHKAARESMVSHE